jgi:microsomal dipeptidase-like Zn-dependent dipeptidase
MTKLFVWLSLSSVVIVSLFSVAFLRKGETFVLSGRVEGKAPEERVFSHLTFDGVASRGSAVHVLEAKAIKDNGAPARAQVRVTPPAIDLTGIYSCDDGGTYFVRQMGDRVFWVGEHPSGAWVNVLSGRLVDERVEAGISVKRLHADWWVVPKGGAVRESGRLVLGVGSDGRGGVRLDKISGPGFGGNRWVKGAVTTWVPDKFGTRPSSFTPSDANLTGIWNADDYGVYYVREEGENVIWFGEHRFTAGTDRQLFANVFVGRREGSTITGEWVDVPKGQARGNGTLTLRVDNPQQMSFVASNAAFGAKLWRRSTPSRLWGFVDMHTHPMAQWAFGSGHAYGELFFGGLDRIPGVGDDPLGDCNYAHNFVVPPFEGHDGRQNMIRNQLVDLIDKMHGIDPVHSKTGGGMPNFTQYPKYNSILHQQMWYEWIKRAYEGGLRVMVALTVNSHLLADAAETSGPNDDLGSMNKQIEEFKKFVARHDEFHEEGGGFMEIAYSPADLRRIVSQNKLAIVLGTEMDNLGNFYSPADPKGARYNPNPTDDQIRAEIDRLYAMGIRYVIPIHITNNVFGGAAIYDAMFDASNKYNTGRAFEVEVVDTRSTGISFKLSSLGIVSARDVALAVGAAPLVIGAAPVVGGAVVGAAAAIPGVGALIGAVFPLFFPAAFPVVSFLGAALPPLTALGMALMPVPHSVLPFTENYPPRPDPGPGRGHRNALGLTPKGEVAIRHMMSKGMIIDIDHMSEKAANRTIEIARGNNNYPLNSGHNGIRSGNAGNENNRTGPQLKYINDSGGLFGLGHGDEVAKFVDSFRRAQAVFQYRPQVAIGTDVNGFYPLPKPPVSGESARGRIRYEGAFTPAQTGRKTWDYNREGVAHYGLLPDYIESWKAFGMGNHELDAFFSSAEGFAQMWERCLSPKLRTLPPLRIPPRVR